MATITTHYQDNVNHCIWSLDPLLVSFNGNEFTQITHYLTKYDINISALDTKQVVTLLKQSSSKGLECTTQQYKVLGSSETVYFIIEP